jgi:uncharacterized protein (TIGR03084 family)
MTGTLPLPQAVDFRAEIEALDALLADVTDWDRETRFKRWTVNDIIQHLHDGDLAAAASVESPEAFTRRREAIQAARADGQSRVQETRQRMGDLTGPRLRAVWRDTALALADRLGVLAPETRLKWAGPDMGVRMFTTARQMETWAHGQAIYDLLGATREPTTRLRNIAEIGVRTYGWTFANRGEPPPGPAPHISLTGPDQAVWTWNEPSDNNLVAGSAEEFCQVVTQTRNIADTALRVVGGPASTWMAIAQCFAGPPEDPPAPGSRRPEPKA